MALTAKVGRPDRPTLQGVSVAERVNDGDVRVDFNGIAVEIGGAIAPQADGVERRAVEERIAGKDFK